MDALIGIAVRIVFLYAYMLAMLRLSGKRSIGNLSPLDFTVAVVLSDLFDDVIWLSAPLDRLVVGLTTIVLLHVLVSYGCYRSRLIDRLVGASRTVVVRQGAISEAGLQRLRLRMSELRSHLRLNSVDQIDDVKEAAWEPSGQLSVLLKDEAKPVPRRERARLMDRIR